MADVVPHASTVADLSRRVAVLEQALKVNRMHLRITPGLMGAIMWTVALDAGVTVRDLTSERRKQPLAEARQMVMWLARELTPLSLPQIGRALGDRDHTTIMHGIERVELRRQADAAFAARLDELKTTLEETLCG